MDRAEAIRYIEQKKAEIAENRHAMFGYNGYDALRSAVDALREQEELARNLHDVASNKQVKKPLYPNGFSDSEVSLANKKQVSEQKQASKWICVSDRLPEPDKRVLVWLADGSNEYTQMDTDRIHLGRWARWGRYVTHWMPLPEPPEEGGDEE